MNDSAQANHNEALNICIWNAHSINNKIQETFTYLKHLNVHVALITETWLKVGTSLFDPEYKIYNLNRKSGTKGGVAILVKRNIQHCLLPSFHTQIIEAIGIDVFTSRGKIKLIAAYFKGGTTNSFLNKFKADIEYLTSFNSNFIIGGDLNAKHPHWNCFKNNRAGSVLYNSMLASKFIVKFPNSPTHYNHNSKYGSTLDIALTNCPQFLGNLKSVQDLSSDHLPVHFQLNSNPQNYNVNCRLNYSAANWKLYKTILNCNLNLSSDSKIRNIQSYNDIDEQISYLNNIILTAKDKCVPFFRPTSNNIEFQIPEPTKMLIRLRNTRRRQFQRTRDPFLKTIVNELHKRISAEFQILKNNRWTKLLENIENDRNTNKMWAISKNLRLRSRQIPPLNSGINNRTLLTNKEKCESLARRFAGIHNDCGTSLFSQQIISEVDNFLTLHTALLPPDNLTMTTPREIKEILRSIRPSKSPGEDTINGRLIKNLPRKAIVFITYLFNTCLKYSYFSKHWKTAKVIPIIKQGKDKSELSSYRPISLLNILGKIFEIVIKKRVDKFINNNNILPDQQFGFRHEFSTQHQALRIYRHVIKAFNQKQSTGLILFDMEKAFDKVWHKGLIYKLIQLKFPLYLIKLISNYISDRQFFVFISGEKSAKHEIHSGVPQGAVLSPILYNLFTADIASTFANVEFAQYADDTAIYTSSIEPTTIINLLQANINALSGYCAKWNIKLNPSKTQAIFFTRRRAARYLPGNLNLLADNIPIPWCRKVKYLGIWFDQKTLFKDHIDYLVERSQKLISTLYPLLCRNSKLSEKNKLLIYKMIIRAAITYGSQIMKHAAYTHKKRLQIVQNRCLKIIRNLPRRYPTNVLHLECSLETIAEFISRLDIKFTTSCLLSNNAIIRNLVS